MLNSARIGGDGRMRGLINNDISVCVGCNRCIRACPVDEANIAYIENGEIKVRIDSSKCIACGACVEACRHESRGFSDDTEKFFEDLRRGARISMFAAPAGRVNFREFGKLFTYLRKQGVRFIYDVSLGADICTWAHIRYIQKNNPGPIITQPCPAIVNYILMYHQDLIPNLSPIHSPMLCTAVYMKKYRGITDDLAVLSPCIAKANEFESTGGLVRYNVTFKKLIEYLQANNIALPREESGFDHPDASFGGLYSMPGGLKENVEFYLGKALRIDKSEGQSVVYKAIDEYAHKGKEYLPAIFDVLNCQEGCNMGTACEQKDAFFEINKKMDDTRKAVMNSRERSQFDELYAGFDNSLKLQDFVRRYTSIPVHRISVNDNDIEQAMDRLDKKTKIQRQFDCSACGAASCFEMASKIAKGVNVVENCMQKNKNDIMKQHDELLYVQHKNAENMEQILDDIEQVKQMSGGINETVDGINTAIRKFSAMAKAIDQIAMNINIISLNASVEAARAGSHGKTFAVVAEEIRNLAASSKKSVSETETISSQALTSIDAINEMVGQINEAVSTAYDNISILAKSSHTLNGTAGEVRKAADVLRLN